MRKTTYRVAEQTGNVGNRPYIVQCNEYGKWKTVPGAYFERRSDAQKCRDTLRVPLGLSDKARAQLDSTGGDPVDEADAIAETIDRANRRSLEAMSAYVLEGDDPAAQAGIAAHSTWSQRREAEARASEVAAAALPDHPFQIATAATSTLTLDMLREIRERLDGSFIMPDLS